MNLTKLAATFLVSAAASVVLGDEILFKNGDRLTGTIVASDATELTIKTNIAGEVKVKLADVKTFSTTEPVQIKMKSGEVVKAPVVTSDEGSVKVAPGALAEGANVALADVEQINPPPIKWTGALVVAGLLTRGNTDTDSLSVSADAARRAEVDRITLGAGYFFGREDTGGTKTTTRDNWFGKAQYDYFLNKKLYLYGNGRVEKDNIANLDLRFTPGVGVGYQWVESAKTNFSTEIGLSYLYEQYEGEDATDSIAARLAYHFDYMINDKVKFVHNTEYLPSLETFSDYIIRTDAGVRADLTKDFFTQFTVELNYDSTPGPDSSRVDLRYLLGVGWRF